MRLLDLLEEYQVTVKTVGEHQHATPSFLQVDCCWCSPDTHHYRLGLALNLKVASCWSCGTHSFLRSLHELTGEAYEVLKSRLDAVEKIPGQHTPRGKLTLPDGIRELLPIHRKYLKDRGFDPDTLSKFWGVRGIGLTTKLAWRLFIPITYQGKVISWTTRAIADIEPRYVNAKPDEEVISAKHVLLGEDLARHAIVIVEGPLDAMRLGPGAVATCGLTYSQSQVRKMLTHPVRIVVFDNEVKAQQRARQLVSLLSTFPGQTYRVELDAADPGSASNREIQKLRSAFLD